MSREIYFKDRLLGIDGKYHYVGEKIAGDYNRSLWREKNDERKRHAPVKRTGSNGEPLEFDDMAWPRECSMDALLASGGEHHLGIVESFEDTVLDRLEKDERMGIVASFIPSLSDDEKDTLRGMALGMSPGEFRMKYGVPTRTYSYRRKKLAEKLKRMVLNELGRRSESRAKGSR